MARPRKNIEDKQIRKFDFGINNDELNLLNKFHLDSGAKIRDYILNNLNKKYVNKLNHTIQQFNSICK